jgi:hypothetical protein
MGEDRQRQVMRGVGGEMQLARKFRVYPPNNVEKSIRENS